jgi:hypothetical protein
MQECYGYKIEDCMHLSHSVHRLLKSRRDHNAVSIKRPAVRCLVIAIGLQYNF